MPCGGPPARSAAPTPVPSPPSRPRTPTTCGLLAGVPALRRRLVRRGRRLQHRPGACRPPLPPARRPPGALAAPAVRPRAGRRPGRGGGRRRSTPSWPTSASGCSTCRRTRCSRWAATCASTRRRPSTAAGRWGTTSSTAPRPASRRTGGTPRAPTSPAASPTGPPPAGTRGTTAAGGCRASGSARSVTPARRCWSPTCVRIPRLPTPRSRWSPRRGATRRCSPPRCGRWPPRACGTSRSWWSPTAPSRTWRTGSPLAVPDLTLTFVRARGPPGLRGPRPRAGAGDR